MDIFERINLHVEGTQQRDEWAKKGNRLAGARKDKARMAAAKKAEALDKKVQALEADKIVWDLRSAGAS